MGNKSYMITQQQLPLSFCSPLGVVLSGAVISQRRLKVSPRPLVQWRKPTRTASRGTRLLTSVCLHDSTHFRRWPRQRRSPFQTSKYSLGICPLARFMLPTKSQHPPYIICEQCSFLTFGSLGALAFQDRLNDEGVLVRGKWCLPTESFVDHHSQRIAIRRLRWMTVRIKTFRGDEFRTHPLNRTTLYI